MARGYIFEIANNSNKEILNTMDESDFYSMCGYMLDYVENVSDDERIMVVSDFLSKLLEKYGFEAGEESSTGNFFFVISNEARQNYFAKRYEAVKKYVGKMTLEEFSKSVIELQNMIDDDCGDAVYFNGTFYHSFDHFIRNAKLNKKYYIGNIVLMH